MAAATSTGRGLSEQAGRLPPPRPNLSEVLRLIWEEQRISRAEIARRKALSRSTVSLIVEELLALGLVREVGAGKSRGGRRPIVLEFDDDAATLLGVDLGATHVAVALTDLRGRVLAWALEPHDVRDDPEGALALVDALVERGLREWGGSRKRLLGVGVAVPSPVDPERPGVLNHVVLPAWQGVEVGRRLEQRFRVPVLVDNDANLGALAERWWGAGRGIDDFVYVKLASGIGAGFFMGGSIYRGAKGIAGEMGHVSIDPGGEPCTCGLRGCLVTRVGAAALLRRARALVPAHPDSVLAHREIDLGMLEDAALADDALALQVVEEAGEDLGVVIAGLLNLFNPARVILGGGLARMGERLLEPVRRVVRSRTLISSVEVSSLVTSELGARASAIGAATLLLDRALSDPRYFPAATRRL